MNHELFIFLRDKHLQYRGWHTPGSPEWLRHHALYISYARVVGGSHA
jgi:hypothetical protein